MLTRLRGAQYTRRTKRACIGTASIARLKSADRTRRQIVAGAIRARTLPVLRRSTGAPRKLAVMHSRSSEGAMSAFGPKRTCRKVQSMSLLGVKRTWQLAPITDFIGSLRGNERRTLPVGSSRQIDKVRL